MGLAFDQVKEGDTLPPFVVENLTRTDLVRYAGASGDFNPIHWLPSYARAAGFRSTVLHGFGTFALAIEALVRRVLSGNVRALATVEARFTKPAK